MNITFLGGGSEIGASSAIVEVGAARLLVDCGLRMTGDSRLPSRPHLYQTVASDQLQREPAAQPAFAESNLLLARVDALLGPHTGLYKRGYHLPTHELRLFFDFPQVARERYQETIDQVVADTGWSVVINEMPQQERLFAAALACLRERR